MGQLKTDLLILKKAANIKALANKAAASINRNIRRKNIYPYGPGSYAHQYEPLIGKELKNYLLNKMNKNRQKRTNQ